MTMDFFKKKTEKLIDEAKVRANKEEILNLEQHSIGYEPKRKNRFTVEFEGTDIQPWVVQSVNRPKFTLGEGWDPIIVKLIDVIGPSTTQSVFNGIVSNVSNMKFGESKIHIKMLDPVGCTVEHWEINGNYEFVDFGHMNYAVDELAEIIIQFQPTKCILKY